MSESFITLLTSCLISFSTPVHSLYKGSVHVSKTAPVPFRLPNTAPIVLDLSYDMFSAQTFKHLENQRQIVGANPGTCSRSTEDI